MKAPAEDGAVRARARAAFTLLAIGFALDASLAAATAAGAHRGVHVMVLGVAAGASVLAGLALLFRAALPDATRPLLLLACVPVVGQMLEWFFLFRGGFDAGLLVAALLTLTPAARVLHRRGGLGFAAGSAAATVAAVVALAELVAVAKAADPKRLLMSKTSFAASEIVSALVLVVLFAAARRRVDALQEDDPVVPGAAPSRSPLSVVALVVLLSTVALGLAGVAASTRALDLRGIATELPKAHVVVVVATAAAIARYARSSRGRPAFLAWASAGALLVVAALELFALREAAATHEASTMEAMLAALSRSAFASAFASVAGAASSVLVLASVRARATELGLTRLSSHARGAMLLFAATLPSPFVVHVLATSLVKDAPLRTFAALLGPAIAGLLLGAQIALLRVLISAARALPPAVSAPGGRAAAR